MSVNRVYHHRDITREDLISEACSWELTQTLAAKVLDQSYAIDGDVSLSHIAERGRDAVEFAISTKRSVRLGRYVDMELFTIPPKYGLTCGSHT